MIMINRFVQQVAIKLLLVLLSINILDVKAYEIPQNTFYVNVDTSTLGNIDIYFPSDRVDYLFYDVELGLINTGSSSITGYVGNRDLTISFPVFSEPTYRDGYNTYDLNITNLVSTNIDFNSSDSQVFMNDTLYQKTLLITVSVGVFFLCLTLFKK